MSKPLRPCGFPTCPVLVKGGNCPAHARIREKDPAQARFYGSARWQAIRKVIRARDPICSVCRRKPSEQVHHKDEDWRNNDPSNLAGICRDCHASTSGRQHRTKRMG